MLKRTPCLQRSMVVARWCSGAAWLLLAVESRCAWGWDGFNQLSGNPTRKPHAVWEDAEAWVSLELLTGQWFQAHQVNQDLVSEKVPEDSWVAVTVAWLEPLLQHTNPRILLLGWPVMQNTLTLKCIYMWGVFTLHLSQINARISLASKWKLLNTGNVYLPDFCLLAIIMPILFLPNMGLSVWVILEAG